MDLRKLSKAQLAELIKKANKRQRDLDRVRIKEVRNKIKALLKAEGFSIDDVFGGRRGRAAAGDEAPAKKRRKIVVKPKYRNPADANQTWSGRGKRPNWFKAALAAGKKEKDLLIA